MTLSQLLTHRVIQTEGERQTENISPGTFRDSRGSALSAYARSQTCTSGLVPVQTHSKTRLGNAKQTSDSEISAERKERAYDAKQRQTNGQTICASVAWFYAQDD
ncbi:hypothetical protein BaRGS_00020490 [Batillaria attramentaria]|uniref:Uncharacterized protein n=1 Tax=Batillaria attramentaria TaxID=370345 RepID=A0ABD0KN24_9CAEN